MTRAEDLKPGSQVPVARLFIMYTASLKKKADEQGVNCHAFANDTQLNERCRCDDTPTAVRKLISYNYHIIDLLLPHYTTKTMGALHNL